MLRAPRNETLVVCIYNVIGKRLSSQRFPSPNLIRRGHPLRPSSANQGARRSLRELLLGEPNDLAAHGEDRSPSPVQNSLQASTTPTTQGRKRRSPGSKPPREVWKPQSFRPIADWLGLQNKASATRGRQGPIPGSEISPHICNSDNLGTKTVISRVETAPHGLETPVPLADR